MPHSVWSALVCCCMQHVPRTLTSCNERVNSRRRPLWYIRKTGACCRAGYACHVDIVLYGEGHSKEGQAAGALPLQLLTTLKQNLKWHKMDKCAICRGKAWVQFGDKAGGCNPAMTIGNLDCSQTVIHGCYIGTTDKLMVVCFLFVTRALSSTFHVIRYALVAHHVISRVSL